MGNRRKSARAGNAVHGQARCVLPLRGASQPMSLSVNQRCSPFAALNPVPAQSVILTKGFWQARQRALFQDGLLAQHAHCERTGRLDNFRRAAGAHKGPYQGLLFNDSDVHKWLEAGYWALGSGQAHPDLERQVQAVTELVLAAQEPDGYLNTHFYDEMAEHKWTNLDDWHELYCAGHFIQAALAAHHNGHPRLLNAAVRLADLICETFGPTSTGQRPGIPGHQGIEIALIELYRLTANKTYLEQAQYFIDERGQGLLGKRSYNQNDKPIREQEQLVGHAVRALYLNIAAADLYAETGDPELKTALERLWVHLNQYQLYVTGGIGSRHASESMGSNYELPNDRAYAETCAAVANVIWNQRMLLIDGERCYADMLELSLFNGALAGISLDTDSYFLRQSARSRSGSASFRLVCLRLLPTQHCPSHSLDYGLFLQSGCRRTLDPTVFILRSGFGAAQRPAITLATGNELSLVRYG